MTNWTELKRLASDMKGWDYLESCWQEENQDEHPDALNWEVGALDEEDRKYPVMTIDTWQYDCPSDAEKLARYYAAANPKTILALIAENERLRDDVDSLARLSEENVRKKESALASLFEARNERDQLRAEVEALRELLRDSCEAIRHGEFSTGICCCGSSVDSHGFGDGHSPVDEGDYYASGLIERIDSALKASQ